MLSERTSLRNGLATGVALCAALAVGGGWAVASDQSKCPREAPECAPEEVEDDNVVLLSPRGLQGASQSFSVRINGEDNGSAAGSVDWRVRITPEEEGTHLVGFCVEPGSGIGDSRTPYVAMSINERLYALDEEHGVERAAMLEKWFGAYYGGHDREDWQRFGSMNKYQVIRAFQLGVWEIMFEDFENIGKLDAGSFQAVVGEDEDGDRLQEQALAQVMFQAVDFDGDIVAPAHLVMLVSDDDGNEDLGEEFQDQVVMFDALPLEIRQQLTAGVAPTDDAVAQAE